MNEADLQQHWSKFDVSPVHLTFDGLSLCGEPVGRQNGPEFYVNSARVCIECAARSLELQAAELRLKGRIDV